MKRPNCIFDSTDCEHRELGKCVIGDLSCKMYEPLATHCGVCGVGRSIKIIDFFSRVGIYTLCDHCHNMYVELARGDGNERALGALKALVLRARENV